MTEPNRRDIWILDVGSGSGTCKAVLEHILDFYSLTYFRLFDGSICNFTPGDAR